MPLLLSSLHILITWLVLALTLLGLGSLLLRFFARNFLLTDAIWVGLGVAVAVLQVWSLLLPINLSVVALLFGLGILGLIANGPYLAPQLSGELKQSKVRSLIYVAIVFFIALRCVGSCDYYDTGLYGIPAVRWAQAYPVVPGLVNLHGRLGFNSSVFLSVAALSQGIWKNLGFHLFAGLLLSLMWLTVLPATSHILGRRSESSADRFNFILAIPLAFFSVRSPIVGTLTDEPATILCLVGAGILFALLRSEAPHAESQVKTDRVITVTVLFALAVTVKLSVAVFAGIAWLVAVASFFRAGDNPSKARAALAWASFLTTCILVPWCVRGVILTGYPFYPAPVFAFPVDWKSPLAMTQYVAGAVHAWGKIPDVPASQIVGYSWLTGWIHRLIRNRSGFQAPAFISIFALAIVALRRIQNRPTAFPQYLWLLLPSCVGIAFWFVASPDLRFAQFAIWTAAATLGAWAIEIAGSASSGNRWYWPAALWVGLLAWCLFSFGWWANLTRVLDSPPLSPAPVANVVARPTRSGLLVNVPVSGNQCWDAPIPCTPYFDDTLRLRRDSSLRSGFQSNCVINFYDQMNGDAVTSR